MSFKTHVFISYAHNDNLPIGKQPGWVTQFQDLLQPILTSRLKRTTAEIWRDKRLSDNDVFDPVIMKQLPDTAVFVAVLTENYVDSEWCLREAQAFCDHAAKGEGLAPADKQRVFKILKLPVPPTQQKSLPEPMQKTLGTKFFVRKDKDERETDDEHDTAFELDGDDKKFLNSVTRLAQDIANTLKAIDAASAPGASLAAVSAGATKPAVYLAECGGDRRGDREALRSELVQRGYPVLPDCELPSGEADLRAEVTRMLERSALAVHLLGTMPGTVPPDSAGMDSELVIQNELSVERARAAPLQRVVSLPAGTVCKRTNHQQFLDAMKCDAAMLGKAELIDGDLEKVKAAMLFALEQIEAPPPPVPEVAPTPGAAVQGLKLYVIFDKPDFQTTGDLRDALGEHFKVLKPVFEGTPEAKREAAKERLIECDAVLVYYGAGTDGWMDSVLSEVEQAVAWRAGRPYRGVWQWVAGPETDDKLDKLRKPKPNVIKALEGFSTALLEPVIKTVCGANHE